MIRSTIHDRVIRSTIHGRDSKPIEPHSKSQVPKGRGLQPARSTRTASRELQFARRIVGKRLRELQTFAGDQTLQPSAERWHWSRGSAPRGLKPAARRRAAGLRFAGTRRFGFAAFSLLLGAGAFFALSPRVWGQPGTGAEARGAHVRFAAVDVYIDSGAASLAAWQFELTTGSGDVKIVGVEGGDHPAFKAPPYYDPKALTQDRIIIAAYSTAENLPSGKTRVARIHVQISGEPRPDFGVQIIVAADQAGDTIKTTATIQQKEST